MVDPNEKADPENGEKNEIILHKVVKHFQSDAEPTALDAAWTSPGRIFKKRTRKRIDHPSFPTVVSGNPESYSLSLMPRTGFPIRFPITNVGNDRGEHRE